MTIGVIIMNKKIQSLLIVAALALPVLAATGATAGPDFCDRKPNHPSCSTTTTTTEPAVAQPCETVTTLLGTGNLGFDCDWTPEESIATTGTVTVTVPSGEVSRVVVFVRDSAPGDICVLKEWDKATGTVFEASFPLVDEVGGRGTYWDNGTNWCEPFDPIVGQRSDLNGDPLHVRVGVRAKKGTVVEVSLSPGQAAEQQEPGNWLEASER